MSLLFISVMRSANYQNLEEQRSNLFTSSFSVDIGSCKTATKSVQRFKIVKHVFE